MNTPNDPPTILPLVARLRSLGACRDALTWAATLPRDTTPEAAYAACERGDWLLWLAATVRVDRRSIVLAACACARTALPIWEARHPDDRRPHAAIETTEGWARGEVSIETVRVAREAAAAAAAADAYAADAAYAYAVDWQLLLSLCQRLDAAMGVRP